MFNLPGSMEWLVIAIIGLLIFGKRLPDVARSLGRTVVEFKRGIRGMEDDIRTSSSAPRPVPPTTSRLSALPSNPPAGGEPASPPSD